MNDSFSNPSTRPVSVKIANLRKSFRGKEVLKGVSLEVKPGEIFAIIGPSGSGKTMLLKHVMGLEEPDSGEIFLNDQPLIASADGENVQDFRLAMVFQSGALLNSLTVAENVGLYLTEHQLKTPEEIDDVVNEKLAIVGLSEEKDKMPAELSGGMKKRVAIARALVIEPQLILYDEPTSELDPISALRVGREILKLKQHASTTSILVTHDRDLAFGIADRVAMMHLGEIVGVGTPAEIRQNNNPFIQEFLEANIKAASPDKFMKSSIEARLGMFVLLALIVAFVIVEMLGGLDYFRPGYHVHARFANIQELKVGDAVKMAGVPVGRVEKLGLIDGKVELLLRLNKGTPVKTDSKAAIKFAGLMGANYVSIDFGNQGSPLMEQDGNLLTVEQPDLNTLMAKLDDAAGGIQNLTKSFTGDKIDNLLGPFTDFMRQNSPRLSAIIANVQGISSQITSGQGTVGKLIFDQSLYNTAGTAVTNLQDAAGEIKATVSQARLVVDQINAGKGTVGKLLHDDKLYVETTASMTNLREILQKINNGNGTVGKLVNDQEFYKDAKLSLQKLDKATESLEDTGPLSVLGSIVTSLSS